MTADKAMESADYGWLTLSGYLQCFYIVAAAIVLLANVIPQVSTRLLPYGKLAQPAKPGITPNQPNSTPLLDALAEIQVPHRYFSHFYVISIASSLLWGYQILTHGPLLRFLLSLGQPSDTRNPTQSMDQIVLAWLCMFAQGVRRYYETVYVSKKSNSQMWFVHYLLGLAYYVATGMAIWVEGKGTLLIHPDFKGKLFGRSPVTAPTWKTTLALPLFIFASGLQNDCHRYLSTLRKYSLPEAPIFRYIICPHYFAECMLYVALTVLTAPNGQLLNKTMLCTTIFVVVNLGVTAGHCYEWYKTKFGEDKVKGRWKMVPYIY
ncbi:hypothetical protein BDZ91DRAFT_724532 [Kalaharituber pfeilii]|nr:hypothetical protein BDZ91DRAFT_724532 [Kalaharituber pfeilii]